MGCSNEREGGGGVTARESKGGSRRQKADPVMEGMGNQWSVTSDKHQRTEVHYNLEETLHSQHLKCFSLSAWKSMLFLANP